MNQEDEREMSKKPEICRMMTLSTAHVSEATMLLLQREPDENNLALTVYPKGQDFEYGCFVYMPERPWSRLPEDLRGLLRRCEEEGCTVLCLDGDAEPLDGVKTYDW